MTQAAYLGPPGTFSDAALAAAGPGFEGVPLATLREVVLAVQNGRFERALVPIENALEGGVDPVLDALALEAPDVMLVGEHLQPVTYCLAAGRQLPLDEITIVLSHPQALGQCSRWLAANAPQAAVLPAASTAEAIRIVAAEPNGTRAALGPPYAAERYDAVQLAAGVEDEPGNATRFAWLAPADAAPPPPAGGPAKTVMLFYGSGSGSPGWLVSCLAQFAFAGVNLTRIESRPLRRGMGQYMFFLDLEGSLADPDVSGAVEGLRRHAEVVRVLGSFPAAAH